MSPPTCWRCHEPVKMFYVLLGDKTRRQDFDQLDPQDQAKVPRSLLCADCTDEMAEANR